MRFNTLLQNIPDYLLENNNIKQIKDLPVIKKAVNLLSEGEVIAFPTETVYGLGADARNSSAVKKIFQAKGRPQDNPLIVHIGNPEQIEEVVSGSIDDDISLLLDKFWPGPLTVVLPKSKIIPERTTAGLNTVGVRMPSHPAALALIQKAGFPLAAPSANTSGLPSPTRAEHVMHDLTGKIPLVIDGGACPVGVESTVITVNNDKIIILRPGGITRKQLEEITRRDVITTGNDKGSKEEQKNRDDETPLAPGMKYRHYSPNTKVILFSSKNISTFKKINFKHNNKEVYYVLTEETIKEIEKINNFTEKMHNNLNVVNMGSKNKLEKIASRIFNILRELDQSKVDLIVVETIPETGIGEAIMNRLYKAAYEMIE